MSKRHKRKVYLCEALESRRLLAVTLTSNTTVTGNIDVAGKSDSYEFSASAGDRIILSAGEGALATAQFNPYIELTGTTGSFLQSNSGVTSAYIELAAPTTGTYSVVVKGTNSAATGDYRLQFDKIPNPGAATDPADGDGKVLTPNSTTTAAIGTVGDIDLYSFTAAVGDRIILSMGEGSAAVAGFDPDLTLYGPTGAQIDTNSTVTSAYIEVTAATAGTYGVLAREYNNNATGDYRLHFEQIPFAGSATDPADGDGKTIASNSTTSGAIATVGDIDLYTFTAAIGDRIILSVGEGSAAVAGFDPDLTLYGPNGAQIDTNSTVTSAYIEVTAATAGTYAAVVREYNNNATGDYQIYFDKAPHTGQATDPADGDGKVLSPNSTTSAAIGAVGDLDLYTFTAAVGDRIVLSVGEGAAAVAGFDPYMALYGPTGAVIDSNSTTTEAFIEVTAGTAGTYTVLVREYNNNATGDYRLNFDKLPFAGNANDPADGEGGALVSNTTTFASIGSIGDLDVYNFTAAVGDRIILSMGEGAAATGTFDPDMTLYGPNGAVIQTDTSTTAAFIEVTAATAGTYNVLIREYNNDTTGDYRLHFVKLPFAGNATDPADGDGKTLVANTTTTAAIGTIADIDLYTFTAAVGDRIVLSMGEGAAAVAGFNPYLALYSPTGAVLQTNSGTVSAFIEVTATTAGTYGVIARAANDITTGDYRLHFENFPFAGSATDPADGDGKSLVSNTTTTGAIGTVGDLDLYTFTAAVGDRIILSMGETASASAGFDPDMTLYGTTGAVILTNSGTTSAYIETTATTAGTYSVLLDEFNNTTTGGYRLHFIKLPYAGSPIDPADGDGAVLSSNTTVSTAIGTIGDVDLYTFTASVGDSFIVSLGDTSGTAFTPYLAIYKPDGTLQTSDTGAAGASADLLSVTTAGTYYVVVEDNNNTNVGNYALHFIKTPGAQPIDAIDTDGGTLTSGQTTSASLTAADLDAYTFSLSAGGGATVRVTELGATAFAPEIDVFGPTGVRVGTNTGAASAIVTLTNVTLGGTYTIVVRDSGDDNTGQYAIALDAVTGADTRAPAVISSRFDYQNIDRQQIVVLLTEGIGGTLEVTDLTLQNLTTNTTVPSANISAVFNSLSNEVVFRFPGFPGGILPDGNYRATLGTGSLSDTAGNLIGASAPLDFFVLAGDANHDRSVGFADLVAVAQHYGTVGEQTYATGDFNYDGNVDFADLVTVAQNYGKTLAPPLASAIAAQVPLAKPTAAALLTGSDNDGRPAKTVFSVTPIAKPAPVKSALPIKPVRR